MIKLMDLMPLDERNHSPNCERKLPGESNAAWRKRCGPRPLGAIGGMSEKLSIGDEYVGTARVKDGRQAQLYRSNEADRYSIGKKYGIKKHDYYLLIKGKGASYVVDTGTRNLNKAAKWAQGYIQRKMSGTGKERFV